MIKASARPKYDTAILGAEYESDTARFLADRLRGRLNESRCVWMRDPSMADADGTTATDACASARTVVVLHDRLWGRTSPTSDDRAAIEARIARAGGASVFFVSLDETPVPSWARKAKVTDLGKKSVDESIEILLESIAEQGGRLRTDVDATARVANDERFVRDRDSYLGSHRSGPACARELERLADDVVQRVESMERDEAAGEIEVRRGAGRCIIQLGPVALTMSWIRSRTDAVIEGRLMIMEWDGIVRRGTDQVPERAPVRHAFQPATLLREDVFVADAATEQSWRWRRDGRPYGTYTSRDLAARCMASLTARLQEVAVGTSV
ncbi:MAG TPA: hypothetical protein VJ650_03120 [Gemmatimonadaceae bacterium]|nr:hypothetical protein [Gemmatimonadaceae bacterium]